MNHTRFPKENHLPAWARRDNQVKKKVWSCITCICRVRLHWSQNRHNTANQHLSGYTSQTRVAAMNPTCVSRLIATQGLLVLRLLIVSDVNSTWCTRWMMIGTNLILKEQHMILLFFKKLHKFVDRVRPEQISSVDHSVGPQKGAITYLLHGAESFLRS